MPPVVNQQRFITFAGETEVDAAQSKIKWSLLTTEVFDTETIVSFSRNFFVLPQICLILRTLSYITNQKHIPIAKVPYKAIQIGFILMVIRMGIKGLFKF